MLFIYIWNNCQYILTDKLWNFFLAPLQKTLLLINQSQEEGLDAVNQASVCAVQDPQFASALLMVEKQLTIFNLQS